MQSGYFNYAIQVAENRWDRSAFLARWWRMQTGDRRWAPPPYAVLRRALVTRQFVHVTRQQPVLLTVEALQGRPRQEGQSGRGLGGPWMEEPVAAAVLLAGPRRQDETAGLGLLTSANDAESLERLLAAAQEQAWAMGCTRLVGPVGLSPHLPGGVLQNHFHVMPPLHTPYYPPYAPEVFASVMTPVEQTRLYHVTVSPADAPAAGPVHITPLHPPRLAGYLRPLLAAALDTGIDAPPPDADEAALLLAWWGAWPLVGWVAVVDRQPAGVALVQPDLAGPVRWARGGRSLWRRPWLAWRARRPVGAGRLLALGVLPAWRGRGIGRQLWARVMAYAAQAGWQELTAGPLPEDGAAASFLTHYAAAPQQTYTIYEYGE